jgi:ABC-type glycerol-3-phosphate transport system substrate-binding protein
MRRRALVILAAIAAAAAAVGSGADAKPDPGWEKMKTLVGTWEGTVAEHPGPVTVTYKLVSNGTSLMETMDVADHSETMITMYAPDSPNGRIVATHYCAAGNQPRMAAKALKGNTLDFQFLDATNVTGGEVMRALEVRFQDADHFQQLWTSRADGKDHTGTFTYTRRK